MNSPCFKVAAFILVLLSGAFLPCRAQSTMDDSLQLKKIFNEILVHGNAYRNLDELSSQIGARLSGSPQAAKSVEWTAKKMKEAGADTVWLQEVMVPHWVRGEKEKGIIIRMDGKKQSIPTCALGMSVSTPSEGITAEVVEVHDFEELKKMGQEKIKGKIVFYNHPFDQRFVNTFDAYGEAGKYRYIGASEAARYGAVASIVRSLSSSDNDYPHTGSQRYLDSVPKIPCAAISTNGANLLGGILKSEPKTKFFLKQSCQLLDSVLSYNVVGEMRGSEYPREIVLAGGHLDSWDLAQGATDDGAGVVQCIEIVRALKALQIKPKRSVRIVAFMNEENGLAGGRKYAELAMKNKEQHIAAMESDAGATTPCGFGLNMSDDKKSKIRSWNNLFLPYNIWDWSWGEDGADISFLTDGQKVPGIGLQVDSQNYFELHHAATDTFEQVNKRELHLGAAAMASLVYLLATYGL